MRNFYRLASGIQVEPVTATLARHPELWDEHKWRTAYKGTPHVDVEDIWLRYSDASKLGDLNDISGVQNDPGSVWYPAAKALAICRPLVLNLMRSVDGWMLERLLVTRIKPGGRILPHADNQGTYVNSGDMGRYHIVLQGLPGSFFKCGDEVVQMLTGEVWWFNPHKVHEVENQSADDRIHLICDIRFWEG